MENRHGTDFIFCLISVDTKLIYALVSEMIGEGRLHTIVHPVWTDVRSVARICTNLLAPLKYINAVVYYCFC